MCLYKVGRYSWARWCPLSSIPGCYGNHFWVEEWHAFSVSWQSSSEVPPRLSWAIPSASWVLALLANCLHNDCPWFQEMSALGLLCEYSKFSYRQTFEEVSVTFLLRLWWKLSNAVHLSFQDLRFLTVRNYAHYHIGPLAYVLFFLLMGYWKIPNLQSPTCEIQHLNLNVYTLVMSRCIKPKPHFLRCQDLSLGV